MNIDARHKQYEKYAPQWQRCRDAAAGGDAVKERGEAYLSALSGQDTAEYTAYQKRADWYGATSRTIQGLTGAVFRREPQIIYPDAGKPLFDDVTLTGRSAVQVAGELLDEIETVGRVGLYVDYPRIDSNDADPDARPYWIIAPTERVINWGTKRIKGRSVLSFVVLEESVDEAAPGDPFTVEAVDQWRVLQLDDAGLYEQVIYRKAENGTIDKPFVEVDRITPTRRGERLDFIPFLFLNACDLLPDVDRPPLLDLVDINLSHYRTSADLEHGRHFTGLPTPWVAGFPRETQLRIGAGVAWVSDDASARAGMLEFTGQGLGALVTGLEHKERLMSVLGARLLEEQKADAEAAETVRLRQAGQSATMARIVDSLDEALTRASGWLLWWGGVVNTPKPPSEQVSVALNRDLIGVRASLSDIQGIVQAFQAGLMSFETGYYNLEKLEMTRPDATAELEAELIEDRADGELLRAGNVNDDERVQIKQTVDRIVQDSPVG